MKLFLIMENDVIVVVRFLNYITTENDAQETVSSVAGQNQLMLSSKKRGYEHINGNEGKWIWF